MQDSSDTSWACEGINIRRLESRCINGSTAVKRETSLHVEAANY